MDRALRFSGLVVLNIIVAVIGTAFVDGALRWAIPPHSVTAVVFRECITSIIGAASLGFSMWRIWPTPATKWTWVVPTAWFAFGLLVLTGGGDVFGQLSGFGLKSNSVAEARSFFLFTVPFIRAVSYSVGAYISSMLRPLSFPSNVVRSPQQ